MTARVADINDDGIALSSMLFILVLPQGRDALMFKQPHCSDFTKHQSNSPRLAVLSALGLGVSGASFIAHSCIKAAVISDTQGFRAQEETLMPICNVPKLTA